MVKPASSTAIGRITIRVGSAGGAARRSASTSSAIAYVSSLSPSRVAAETSNTR